MDQVPDDVSRPARFLVNRVTLQGRRWLETNRREPQRRRSGELMAAAIADVQTVLRVDA